MPNPVCDRRWDLRTHFPSGMQWNGPSAVAVPVKSVTHYARPSGPCAPSPSWCAHLNFIQTHQRLAPLLHLLLHWSAPPRWTHQRRLQQSTNCFPCLLLKHCAIHVITFWTEQYFCQNIILILSKFGIHPMQTLERQRQKVFQAVNFCFTAQVRRCWDKNRPHEQPDYVILWCKPSFCYPLMHTRIQLCNEQQQDN